jgi:hypothetical protein
MTIIRFRIIILSGWFVLFFIITRLLNAVAIGNLTVGLVFVMVFGVLVFPRILDVRLSTIMLIPTAAVLVIQFGLQDLSGDLAIFLAVLEVLAAAVTIFLSIMVSTALRQVENTVANINLRQHEEKVGFASSGLESIYREVRRARNHQRPLAIMSIEVDKKSIELVMERTALGIERMVIKQHMFEGLSKMLCDELEDCAVIVQDTNHFLVVLPETLPEELPVVVHRLRQKASTEVDVEIKIGVAALPQDGYTFEGLVERAISEMERDGKLHGSEEVDQYSLEHPIKT